MLHKLIASLILVFVLSSAIVSCGNGESSSVGSDISDGDKSALPSDNVSTGNGSGSNTDGSSEIGANSGSESSTDNSSESNTSDDRESNTNEGESAGGSTDDSTETDSTINDNIPENNAPILTVGSEVGNLCPSLDLERIGGGTVNIEDYRGKVIIVNAWGTWCPPCRNELPDFDRIASEYDDVVIIAAHSYFDSAKAESYVNTNFPNTKIIFAYDTVNDDCWSSIGGVHYYPRTVVLDINGVITFGHDGAISYEALKQIVENAGAEG